MLFYKPLKYPMYLKYRQFHLNLKNLKNLMFLKYPQFLKTR
jgi:hypothetical protein